MKTILLALSVALAASTVGCAAKPAPAPVVAPSVNAADWTPPDEVQMTLPDQPAMKEAKRVEPTGHEQLRPTSFSQGKKGYLVNLPTKHQD
jgi:hypothetical protein